MRKKAMMMSSVGKTDYQETALELVCTTTGAQTLTLNSLDAVAGKTLTVDWEE